MQRCKSAQLISTECNPSWVGRLLVVHRRWYSTKNAWCTIQVNVVLVMQLPNIGTCAETTQNQVDDAMAQVDTLESVTLHKTRLIAITLQ